MRQCLFLLFQATSCNHFHLIPSLVLAGAASAPDGNFRGGSLDSAVLKRDVFKPEAQVNTRFILAYSSSLKHVVYQWQLSRWVTYSIGSSSNLASSFLAVTRIFALLCALFRFMYAALWVHSCSKPSPSWVTCCAQLLCGGPAQGETLGHHTRILAAALN